MMSHMLDMTEPSLKFQLFSSYMANNYINNTYFICLLATWGNTRETPKVLTCSSTLKLITLHTLYKVSCQDLFIIILE